MCSFKECGRYWVRIMTSTIPELTQLESVKSMIRYFPANGTAGLARLSVSTPSRDPSPPARITARVLMPSSSQRARTLVQLDVAGGGAAPREVSSHPARLNFGPVCGRSVYRHAPAERVPGRARMETVEQEPGPAGIARVGDGVGEASRPARDGDRAVAHRDHLGQPARLVARGDQDHVRPGIDRPGEPGIEAQAHRGAPGMVPLDHCELVLEARLAGAEQEELPA